MSWYLRSVYGIVAVIAFHGAALAHDEWQLLNDGTPLAGGASLMVRTLVPGSTFLRIEDQFMVPQWWSLQGNTWVRTLEDAYPEPLYKASVAYDSDRNVIVRFGGADKNVTVRSDTWEFNGTTWVHRTDVGAPPPRIRAGMAYDSNRHVMVLFGGSDQNDQALNDTWEYDGVQWQQRTFNTKPAARRDASMAFDASRRRIVLAFGQSETVSGFNDTWEYSGNKWSKPQVSSPPAPRSEAAAAFDSVQQAVYVFGGETTGQTLKWTGSEWQLVPATTHPTGRFAPSMAFDPDRGRIVLFGGVRGPDALDDTWEFDGTTWTPIVPTASEAKRQDAGVAYDTQTTAPLAYGGYRADDSTPFDRTARWTGSAWTDVAPTGSPGRRTGVALDGMPTTGIILFGGFDWDLNSAVSSTWQFDSMASAWYQLSPVHRPSARSNARAVYSAAHGGIVLFGGEDSGGTKFNDTWVFVSGDWQQLTTPVRPVVRTDFGLAADTVQGKVVLYGGLLGTPLDDTWLLTGSTWVQLQATGPGPRAAPSMVFDPSRGLSVLAGGAGLIDDAELTWEFDGSAWHSASTRYSPDMRRSYASAVWDPDRRVMILTGGGPSGESATYSDTWAYGADDDGDLRVGGYDNCPNVANANQSNLDGDSAGDVCDCAPSDASAWSTPQPVTGLALSGAATTTLTWADQSLAVGPGVQYDVATGDLIQLQASGSFAGATCLVDRTATASASDGRVPGIGAGYYYLARSRNVCGIGSYGAGPLDATSPCP